MIGEGGGKGKERKTSHIDVRVRDNQADKIKRNEHEDDQGRRNCTVEKN